LNKFVNVLPDGMNDPFHESWVNSKYVAPAATFLRLRSAQLRTEEKVPMHDFRPGLMGNVARRIFIKVPNNLTVRDFDAAFGAPSAEVNEGRQVRSAYAGHLFLMSTEHYPLNYLGIFESTVDDEDKLLVIVG